MIFVLLFSRSESEIEIPPDRDREVKFHKKAGEFSRNWLLVVLTGHLGRSDCDRRLWGKYKGGVAGLRPDSCRSMPLLLLLLNLCILESFSLPAPNQQRMESDLLGEIWKRHLSLSMLTFSSMILSSFPSRICWSIYSFHSAIPSSYMAACQPSTGNDEM